MPFLVGGLFDHAASDAAKRANNKLAPSHRKKVYRNAVLVGKRCGGEGCSAGRIDGGEEEVRRNRRALILQHLGDLGESE